MDVPGIRDGTSFLNAKAADCAAEKVSHTNVFNPHYCHSQPGGHQEIQLPMEKGTPGSLLNQWRAASQMLRPPRVAFAQDQVDSGSPARSDKGSRMVLSKAAVPPDVWLGEQVPYTLKFCGENISRIGSKNLKTKFSQGFNFANF